MYIIYSAFQNAVIRVNTKPYKVSQDPFFYDRSEIGHKRSLYIEDY